MWRSQQLQRNTIQIHSNRSARHITGGIRGSPRGKFPGRDPRPARGCSAGARRSRTVACDSGHTAPRRLRVIHPGIPASRLGRSSYSGRQLNARNPLRHLSHRSCFFNVNKKAKSSCCAAQKLIGDLLDSEIARFAPELATLRSGTAGGLSSGELIDNRTWIHLPIGRTARTTLGPPKTERSIFRTLRGPVSSPGRKAAEPFGVLPWSADGC